MYGDERTTLCQDDTLRRVLAVQKSLRRLLNSRKKLMQNPQTQLISQRTKDLIDKLLLGKFSLAEIAKVTGISEQWLKNYLAFNSPLISK
jgi:hypothetical protein